MAWATVGMGTRSNLASGAALTSSVMNSFAALRAGAGSVTLTRKRVRLKTDMAVPLMGVLGMML